MKPQSKFKNNAINISLLFVSFLFCGLVLEVGLRVIHLLQQEKIKTRFTEVSHSNVDEEKRNNEWTFFEYDSLLGWKNKAGGEGMFTIPDSKTLVKINAKGLRDSEHRYGAHSQFRILILGDSFTWGFGVSQEERFSQQLAQWLGDSVEIINAGVSGYGTDQELLAYLTEGVKYQPDLVICAFGLEDIINNNHSVQYTYPKPYFTLEEHRLCLHNVPVPKRKVNWRSRFNIYIDDWSTDTHSQVQRYPKKQWQRFKHLLRTNLLSYQLLVNQYHALVRPDEEADPLTEALLSEFNQRVKSAEAKFLVVMIPYKRLVTEDEEKVTWTALRDFFQRQAIALVDLKPTFQAHWRMGENLFFRIDDHWSPAGHELAAKVIGDYLKNEKLIH